MTTQVVRNLSRNSGLIKKVVSSNRAICTSSPLLKKKEKETNSAWSYIIPFAIRAYNKSQETHRNGVWENKRHRLEEHTTHEQLKEPKWEDTVAELVKSVEKILGSEQIHELTADEQVKHDSQVFEVRLDVKHYSPDEVDVKVTGDRLTITAGHGKKQDKHGFVSRKFYKDFEIPDNVKIETFESSVSDSGVLVLRAEVEGAGNKAKMIPIKFEPKQKTDQDF